MHGQNIFLNSAIKNISSTYIKWFSKTQHCFLWMKIKIGMGCLLKTHFHAKICGVIKICWSTIVFTFRGVIFFNKNFLMQISSIGLNKQFNILVKWVIHRKTVRKTRKFQPRRHSKFRHESFFESCQHDCVPGIFSVCSNWRIAIEFDQQKQLS